MPETKEIENEEKDDDDDNNNTNSDFKIQYLIYSGETDKTKTLEEKVEISSTSQYSTSEINIPEKNKNSEKKTEQFHWT